MLTSLAGLLRFTNSTRTPEEAVRRNGGDALQYASEDWCESRLRFKLRRYSCTFDGSLVQELRNEPAFVMKAQDLWCSGCLSVLWNSLALLLWRLWRRQRVRLGLSSDTITWSLHLNEILYQNVQYQIYYVYTIYIYTLFIYIYIYIFLVLDCFICCQFPCFCGLQGVPFVCLFLCTAGPPPWPFRPSWLQIDPSFLKSWSRDLNASQIESVRKS